MYFIFFLILCTGVVLLVLQQQGKLPNSKPKRELPTAERNIFNLEIGDIVQHEGIDWFVEGKLIYNDGSDSWFSYLLQDNETICWLSVEEDDLVEVSIFHQTSETIPQPLPTEMNYLGEDYSLSQSGTATMRRLGNTLNRQQQTCNYYDYHGDRNLRLSVEIWDGDVEVSVGQKINPRMLNFLPGDGQKVYGE
jgi:hypothetical protein